MCAHTSLFVDHRHVNFHGWSNRKIILTTRDFPDLYGTHVYTLLDFSVYSQQQTKYIIT